MKRWILTLLVLPLAACSAALASSSEQQPQARTSQSLPVLGKAPDLENQTWLNTEAPLRLADLRGQVVLLDMWTFG